MFKKVSEKLKQQEFINLKEQFESNGKINDFNNKYFLEYIFEKIQFKSVEASYKFGFLQMKEILESEQLKLNYPMLIIGKWTLSITSSANLRFSVHSTKSLTEVTIHTDMVTPTPDQVMSLRFTN